MMQTIRQAFTILKQNPLLSTISILGTAFAITMIMAIVITWQTKYADLEPEVNRSRCLYFSAMHVQGKENKDWNNFGKPSAAFMKECIQPLPEVEACTAFSTADVALVSLTDGNNRLKVDAMSTDPDFWKIFKLQFLDGKSFTEAERGGDMQSVVISASVARKLFGTTEAAGRQMLLNREVVRIIGVVKDISVTAKDAYAQVWSMYHSNELNVTGWWSYKQGLGCVIVADVNNVWSNIGPNLPMLYLQYGIALLIILLVPSLNLCGLSNSRMQQRVSELGVRKAFGATDGTLVRQILNENLVLTLIGGVVGLIFSYLAVYAMRTWLFTNSDNIGTAGDFSLSMGALFSPAVFVLAFVFCLLINLLSAGLPAWLATRRTIVDSLNDK